MFCTAYLGPTPAAWRDAVWDHAAWLGLQVSTDARHLPSGAVLEVAWLHTQGLAPPRVHGAGDWFVLGAYGDVPPEILAARDRAALERAAVRRADNVATLAVHRVSGDAVAVVPVATPHQLLVAPAAGGRVFGDDLRLFRRLTAAHLDDRALFALAQFGSVPSPWTLFREVRRVPNGHAARFAAGSPGFDAVPFASVPDGPTEPGTAPDRLEGALLTMLRSVPSPATLFFSGGVDSGLLAAAWRRLGRPAQLVNYGFAPDDAESRLAASMAAHLGFELRRIGHEPHAVRDVIARIGRDYTCPFGDISAVPTNILVHATAGLAPRGTTALEGTGADGAYGFGAAYPFWRAVYLVPRPLRQLVAAGYRAAQLWRHQSKPVYALRFMRKSARMSLAEAVITQHSLDGIAMHSTPALRRDLADVVRAGIDPLAAGLPPAERLSLVDLVLVCAGRMAPKSFDPLRQAGIVPRYPYLEPPMLAVSASLAWAEKCAGGERKAPLKTLLARDVPRAWVYRTKHGFTPPEREILSTSVAQEGLQATVLAPGGPLAGLCDAKAVRTLTGLIRRVSLGSGVHDLLWVLLFTATWLDQVPSARPAPTPVLSGAPR